MKKKQNISKEVPSAERKKASFEKKVRLDKRKLWLFVSGGVVCVVALLVFALPKNKAQEPFPISSASQGASLAASVKESTIPSSMAPSEPLPVSLPSSQGESQGASIPVTQPPVLPEFAFKPEEIATLNGMLAEWAAEAEEGEEDGHNVAVYFLDITTGLTYVYNGEQKFEIASIVKAPYAMYLYQLAEKGQCDLEEKFMITKEFAEESSENSGKIKDDPDLPREYTFNELMYYMLRFSDTAAQRTFMKKYSSAGYAAYAAGLGLHFPEDVRGITSGKITAVDAGVYLNAMYGYMQYGQHGGLLKEHLMNTRNRMISSQYPIARKYGWDKNAYHDIAIVYAPHPYLLAILTDKGAGTAAETAMFGKISRTIEEMMLPKWNEVDEILTGQ